MAASEAQRRASAKYNKEHMVQKVVRFSPNERDLLAHLEAQPNMAGYIKALIRADMEAGGAASRARKRPRRRTGALL